MYFCLITREGAACWQQDLGADVGLDNPDSGGQSLTGAVDWLRDVLLGSAGTTISILAVAGIGLFLLSGRLPIRRGVTTIIGCFILFSAGTIANGLLAGSALMSRDVVSPPEPPTYKAATPTPLPYDLYEGAAAPVRPQRGLLD